MIVNHHICYMVKKFFPNDIFNQGQYEVSKFADRESAMTSYNLSLISSARYPLTLPSESKFIAEKALKW